MSARSEVLIPKLLHTVWLSGESKPPLIKRCIESLERQNPSYALRIWTLADLNAAFPETPPWFHQSIAHRKWAFATDWARLAILEKFGGIYFDSDVLVHKTFDPLLDSRGFIGWESPELLGPHVIGSVPGHTVVRDWLDIYGKREFLRDRNILAQTPMPDLITDCSVMKHGLRRTGLPQVIDDHFEIRTADILTSRINDNCIAEHLYAGSWLPTDYNVGFADNLRTQNAIALDRSAPKTFIGLFRRLAGREPENREYR